MTKTVRILAALAFLAQFGATTVALADSTGASSEGTFDPANFKAGVIGNVALQGYSYNDGSR